MLLTEAKNNKNKMARWTAEAIMGGAEAIKWGYVSRAGPKDSTNHVVLNVQVRRGGEREGGLG
jgi:translation initiation factor 3 subunit D